MKTLPMPPIEHRPPGDRRGTPGTAFILALPLGIAFWSAIILAIR